MAMKFYDKEDKALYESLQRGDYIPVKDLDVEMKKIKWYLKEYHAKKSISIRVANSDLAAIQSKAEAKGIPYQTYLNMLIHEEALRA